MPGFASKLWVQRALLLFALALTLGPLVAAVARRDAVGWNDLFEFLVICWFVEIAATLAGGVLVGLLKDERAKGDGRSLRAELLIARLALFGSLLLCLALPFAIAWVFNMGFSLLS